MLQIFRVIRVVHDRARVAVVGERTITYIYDTVLCELCVPPQEDSPTT